MKIFPPTLLPPSHSVTSWSRPGLSLFLLVALIWPIGWAAGAESKGKTGDDGEAASPPVVKNVAKDLEQFKGKVVLLDLWTTWCGPCRIEIPTLINLQQKYGDKGLVVVGVSLDPIDPRGRGGKAAVAPFVRKTGINYTVWMIEDLEAIKTYDWEGAYPTTYLIGRDGRVLKHYRGAQPEEAFETDLKSLL